MTRQSNNRFRRHEKLWGILIFIITCLLCIAFLEVFFRISDNKDGSEKSQPGTSFYKISENPILIYEPEPGTDLPDGRCLNEDGFWKYGHRNLSRRKENGIYRIMVLGDSITFGFGVTPAQNYTTVLDKYIRDSGLDNVEVINCGVSGYNTLQEVEQFRVKGFNYDPDLIILGFCFNDAVIQACELTLLNREINTQLECADKKAVVPEILQKDNLLWWLKEKSRLFSYFYDRFDKKRINKDYQDAILRLAYENQKKYQSRNIDRKKMEMLQEKNKTLMGSIGMDEKKIQDMYYSNPYASWALDKTASVDGWSRVLYACEQLRQTLGKKQTQIIVAIFPVLADYKKYPFKAVHNFFDSEFERLGFHVIDLLPLYSEYDIDELYCEKKDSTHPNGLGHKIAADAIFTYIKSNIFNGR